MSSVNKFTLHVELDLYILAIGLFLLVVVTELAYSPILVDLVRYNGSPRPCSRNSANVSAPAIPAAPASSSSSASTISSDEAI
ncbi:hypothetical protein CNMCM6936_002685 [Aspergillus lentulus]|nr:hypothetical protein CNMCM6069_002420 [Aspergillus lentulus]KAF4162037.1 hypothetical protein CNMCM6936_002685 [Aspergillus lentulus]KAF4170392.1 hypothetical protein CNMCM8060_005548 [Aspergillus lentulus]KAF4191722.1 hypothetical protein CNMCM8694_001395 [Aspergillus lentulus]